MFSFAMTMVMYLTPILYASEMIPEVLRGLLIFNPMADVMALIQGWIHGFPVTAGQFFRPLGLWLVLLAPAWAIFHRSEPHMREML